MNECRRQFEEWAKIEDYDLKPSIEIPPYFFTATQRAWLGWQACWNRRLSVGQIMESGPVSRENARNIHAAMGGNEDVGVNSLESQLATVTAQRDRLMAALEMVRDCSLNPAHTMTKLGLEECIDACHKVAIAAIKENP